MGWEDVGQVLSGTFGGMANTLTDLAKNKMNLDQTLAVLGAKNDAAGKLAQQKNLSDMLTSIATASARQAVKSGRSFDFGDLASIGADANDPMMQMVMAMVGRGRGGGATHSRSHNASPSSNSVSASTGRFQGYGGTL